MASTAIGVKKYTKLQKKLAKSPARNLLLNKPITRTYRNQSLDDYMAEMIKPRSELNCIGDNFNQAVKRPNSLQQIAKLSSWIITYELEKKSSLIRSMK